MSLEKYLELTDEIELKLDEADRFADESSIRYSNNEVFGGIKEVFVIEKGNHHRNFK